MGGKVWTKETALEAFKQHLLTYGETIPASKYDNLHLEPSRNTLLRLTSLSWEQVKARVLPESGDVHRRFLTKQNQGLLEQLEKQRNIIQVFIDNCFAEIGKVSFKPIRVPHRENHTENLEFHALRSDAQVGQKTDAKWVQGLSHYDVDTYLRRLERWCHRVITFREQDKSSLGLNKLVMHFLGDQVEGESIYRGQAFYLDANLINQLFRSIEAEASTLMTLASTFPEVEVFCVQGNHGRIGGKGDHSEQTNFDYLFYRCLQKWTERQANIKVYVSESPSMIVQHGDFVFALNHGDAAKAWNGIPFYGLERMMRRLPDLYGMVIHYGLYGHHHQSANIADRIIMNGCMPGGSDLSINRMGLNSLPSQKVFYFHPKHGINRETNLHLADPVKLQPDNNGIFTAYV